MTLGHRNELRHYAARRRAEQRAEILGRVFLAAFFLSLIVKITWRFTA